MSKPNLHLRAHAALVLSLLAGTACQRAVTTTTGGSTAAASSAAAATTTVILVRHAERPAGADPDLNAAGLARAESLAVSLARSGVAGIIHTQFKRTQQTAAPLATRLSLTPVVVTAGGTEAQHAAAVIEQINKFAGTTVVYVGHSNTVPAVIQALGITPAQPIAETEYNNLFIVTRSSSGAATLVRAKYGAP